MEVQLNPSSVGNLVSVAEALKSDAAVAADVAPVLSAANVNVTEPVADLESLFAKLLMQTNEAKLNAARSRLASALDQLTGLGEAEQNTVSQMREVAEAQVQAEKTLEEKGRELESAEKDFEAAEKTLETAKDTLASAEKDFAKADARYADAVKALEDYLATADAQDSAQVATLEANVASAKKALDSAAVEVDAAGKNAASAEKRLGEASSRYDAAKSAYDAAFGELSALQSRFETLLESLDSSSLTALREAVRLDIGDVDHLNEEIEEDDKTHDLATVKAVEDVIADALDRMDGKIVDEVANRHLDHI